MRAVRVAQAQGEPETDGDAHDGSQHKGQEDLRALAFEPVGQDGGVHGGTEEGRLFVAVVAEREAEGGDVRWREGTGADRIDHHGVGRDRPAHVGEAGFGHDFGHADNHDHNTSDSFSGKWIN